MAHYTSFEEALSENEFEERGNQREVFDAFRAGKHIILHAPTGWGKTFAVTAALKEGHAIYSLPLRVLVDSLATDATKYSPKINKAQHGGNKSHSLLDRGEDLEKPVELVFTTLDQTLSAFLGIPIGVSYRQGNILPAVVDASHLIFDEFHLFEAEKSWTTALFALTQSQQNGIILTATLSDVMLDFLVQELEKTEVGKTKGVALIRGMRPFVNTKILRKGPRFEDVSQLEIGERTLIIRNQIQWAKDTAKALREHLQSTGQDIPVYLLHSELLPEHRKKIETKIQQAFNKNSTDRAVLVSTQVVEAGIDISSDVMHTDLCPPASLIQRIGRNARYAGQSGVIYWHDVDTHSPYSYKGAEREFSALEKYLDETDLDLTEVRENEIVNLCESTDKKRIGDYRTRDGKAEIGGVRAIRDYGKYGDMIRLINSINVAIGDEEGKRYKFINVGRNAFRPGGKFGKSVGTRFYRYDSESKENVPTANFKFADFALFDPQHVAYDPQLGIILGESGGAHHFLDTAPNARIQYSYELESYEQHIRFLHEEKAKVDWMINKLAENQHVGSRGRADFLVDFVIWAHDLGKLNWEWQACHGVSREGVAPGGYPIGHSGDDTQFKRIKPPPSHAWMSAWAVKPYLESIMGKCEAMFLPVLLAISEHHGYLVNFSGQLGEKRFEPFTLGYLPYLDRISQQSPWKQYGWSSEMLTTSVSATGLDEVIGFFRNNRLGDKSAHDFGLYYQLSYLLRRCDQLATARVSNSKFITDSPQARSLNNQL